MPVCLEVDNKLGRRVLKKCGVRSEIETLLCRVSLMLFLLEEPTHCGRQLRCWCAGCQWCSAVITALLFIFGHKHQGILCHKARVLSSKNCRHHNMLYKHPILLASGATVALLCSDSMVLLLPYLPCCCPLAALQE